MRDLTILATALTVSIFLFCALVTFSGDHNEAVIELSENQIIELYKTK